MATKIQRYVWDQVRGSAVVQTERIKRGGELIGSIDRKGEISELRAYPDVAREVMIVAFNARKSYPKPEDV